jgi:hypothetical protein
MARYGLLALSKALVAWGGLPPPAGVSIQYYNSPAFVLLEGVVLPWSCPVSRRAACWLEQLVVKRRAHCAGLWSFTSGRPARAKERGAPCRAPFARAGYVTALGPRVALCGSQLPLGASLAVLPGLALVTAFQVGTQP